MFADMDAQQKQWIAIAVLIIVGLMWYFGALDQVLGSLGMGALARAPAEGLCLNPPCDCPGGKCPQD